jgi:extracellular elastinolytic metalloproteinase
MAEVQRTLPENFHALYDVGARAERGTAPREAAPARTEGHIRLADEVGELSVDYDEATGLPKRISRAEPTTRLTESAAASPEDAVTDFIDEHRDLWRLSEADASGIDVVSVSRRGLPTVQLVQRTDGVEVFNSEVQRGGQPVERGHRGGRPVLPGRGFGAGVAASQRDQRRAGDRHGRARPDRPRLRRGPLRRR